MNLVVATVLIVDDELPNRRLLEVMLKPEGYLTRTASNGEQALASVARKAPDLILLDIMMPGLDGYEVARILKADPATSHIPIIMVTASSDGTARRTGLAAGAEEFLTKPVDRTELWLRVRNLLRLKALSDFLRSHGAILEQEVSARTAELQLFRSAMDATADAITLINRTTMQFVEVNTTACEMFGYSREEFLQLGPVPLASRNLEELEALYDGIIEGPTTDAFEERWFQRKDGSRVLIEIRRHCQRHREDWIIVSFARDITERKVAHDRIVYLNRVYALLSGVNSLIVRVHSREELFEDACRIAVEAGQFKLAWIGLVDRDTQKVAPVAYAGEDAAFWGQIKGVYAAGEVQANSLVGLAVREGKALVSNEIRGDSRVLFAEEHRERGNSSMAALPLLVAGKPVAVLALFTQEPGFFSEEEMRVLVELSGDLGFAMDHLQKDERLEYLAFYDEITGLPNRALLLERVGQYLKPREGAKNVMAVALLDVDRFRAINDTLGRNAGDELLKSIAQRLQSNASSFDTLGRVGVDCFGIVILDPADVAAVALKVEGLIRSSFGAPFQLAGSLLNIGVKAGIALHPLDGIDAEALLRNADAALKRAKRSSETLMFYAPEMNTRVAAALDMESRLRTALDLDQFVLHYQPKVSFATGELTGVEGLIRWNDPQTGLIPPNDFIPLLEETGMIYDVGRWALRTAVADYLRWRRAGLRAVPIAVNVSPLQLRHRRFVSEIEDVISVDRNAAAGLELELTEGVIMDDVVRTIDSLELIRELGIEIAIDDFGTGFSSLSYLSKLPVNTLKIDRSFVTEISAAESGLTLVSTIVGLAHALKLKVVAEGVETEDQARLLRTLNCDEMQGFLFSKPLPSALLESRFLSPVSVE